MSFSMSQTLFPTLEIGLSVLSGLLDKAEAFAAAKKIDPSVLLSVLESGAAVGHQNMGCSRASAANKRNRVSAIHRV